MEASEKFDVSKGVVPLVTAIGIISTLCAIAYNFGVQNNKIANSEERILKIETHLSDIPTRREFDELKMSITKLDDKLMRIMEKLKVD